MQSSRRYLTIKILILKRGNRDANTNYSILLKLDLFDLLICITLACLLDVRIQFGTLQLLPHICLIEMTAISRFLRVLDKGLTVDSEQEPWFVMGCDALKCDVIAAYCNPW
jgi:hypothetical protein